jgi:predicted P-loop ATPase
MVMSLNSTTNGESLQLARAALARGIKLVPVPIGGKGPKITEWQNLDITADNVDQYFNGAALNVGMQMGPKSGGLTDVDLDCAEAVALAPFFLPPTGSVYGRPGKRRSHWLYTCDDPDPKAWIKQSDEEKACIVELRLGGGGKGAQSLMPGSKHAKSGETYEWDDDGDRASATCATLKAAVTRIAAATILARHWPDSNRHDAAITVGGFLARAGWEREAIGHFIEAVQTVAGVEDTSHIDDGRQAALDAARRHADGGHVYGLPQMKEFFGDKVALRLAKTIGYRGSKSTSENEEGFIVDGHGKLVKTSQHNIRHAIEKLGIEISYDVFHDLMLIDGVELNDPAMIRLWLAVDDEFELLPTKDFFFTVIIDAARMNSFHPIRDYLDSLTWDGVKRLDQWLITYGKAKDSEYTRAVGAITLIAAVRRARQPGCKYDEMLVLESAQGMEKSSALSTLAVVPDRFSDNFPLNAKGREVIEQLRGKWIIEAADLSGMRKTEVEHLKSLLSRQTDRGRCAYDRITTDLPRQCIVVGTTNDSSYLKDTTGNRRFWPVAVGRFDLDGLRRDRDQLWAEAAARESQGESIRLDQNLWEAAADEQAERTVEDPWQEILDDVLGDVKGKLLATDTWSIVGIDPGHRIQDHNARLGRAMKRIGFARKKLRIEGVPRWTYAKGSASEQEVRIIVDHNRNRVAGEGEVIVRPSL